VAARAAERLGLPANAPAAAEAARNKLVMRRRLLAAGVPQPRFFACDRKDPVAEVARRVEAEVAWPCVIKPLLLSASRGVMRVDDPHDLSHKLARLSTLLARPELAELDATFGGQVLVESFVPGAEVALEGLLDRGSLRTLALYDKPDPLDGPFFEETIYLTPSRLPAATQEAVREVTARAAAAMGLTTGPVHAELRLTPGGPVAIEVAARSIGGLCSRMLRFGTGMSLEEVLVRHALGQDVAGVAREASAAGVIMLPIPRAGVLKAVDGVDGALEVDGIEDVVISQEVGRELVPLPEGSSYLGFVFARGASAEAVERSLRRAQAALRFTITPTLPAT
jgi:biotin carboxylase